MNEIGLLSVIAGVPVFTSPMSPFPGQRVSAYYSTGDALRNEPYIWMRSKYSKPLVALLQGKRPKNVTKVAQGLQIFANEYAHFLGLDKTDVGGFDGGGRHRPTIMRLSNELLTKMGIKGPYRQKVLAKVKDLQRGTIKIPANMMPRPQVTQHVGPIPIIGPSGVIGYA